MKNLFVFFSVIVIFIFNCAYAQTQSIKLYAIDCGRIGVSNLAGFSDVGDYDNKSVELADPCFLIVHPKGILLWDTGLPDSLVKKSETMGVYHLTKSTTIADSLKKLI